MPHISQLERRVQRYFVRTDAIIVAFFFSFLFIFFFSLFVYG